MILNICQLVQEQLREFNHPPKPSFYDEMMENRQKQEEEKEAKRNQELVEQQRLQQKQVKLKI